MKYLISIILVALVLCLVIGTDSNDSLGVKHLVSSKHERVHMVNDSMMAVHDTVININHWIVPHPDSVEIFISEDSIDLKKIIIKDSGTPATARDALVYLGKCFFSDRTLARKSTCADCHALDGSGTGFTNKNQGGGMEVEHRNLLYEWWTGNQTYIELDKKPFKNFSILNSFRLHKFGKILSHALEFLFPLEGQVGKAMEAHFVSDAVLQCQQVPMYNRIAVSIFGRPLDENIYKMAISAFEQTLTTYDNNINLIARGKSNKLYYADAFVDLNESCAGCHQTHKMSVPKSNNPLHTRVKATGLDLNNAYHKGYFHTSDKISLGRASYMCSVAEGLDFTIRETGTMAASIRQNLTDDKYN